MLGVVGWLASTVSLEKQMRLMVSDRGARRGME